RSLLDSGEAPSVRSFRRNHLGDTAHAGVARVQVVLLVHHPIAGFDELTVSDTHAVADCAEHPSIPIQLQELAVLTARHPRLAVRVEVQGTYEIPHLHRLEKLAVARVDDDPVFLA